MLGRNSEETNLNYLNKRARMGHISARNTYWKELEYDSLLHYLGIFMYMGINKLPDYKMHWNKELWDSKCVHETCLLIIFLE